MGGLCFGPLEGGTEDWRGGEVGRFGRGVICDVHWEYLVQGRDLHIEYERLTNK